MYRLPENAYPSASIQLLETVRAMTRVKEAERRSAEAAGKRWVPTWYAGARILREMIEDPLELRNLHRLNWKTGRPRVFVWVYLSDRNDELVMTVSPNAEGMARYYAGPFNLGIGTHDVGDFQHFPSYGHRDYGYPILTLPIDCDMAGTTFSDYGHRFYLQRQLRGDPALRTERHLCTLLVQAKLHQLSQHFDVSLCHRLVEWGDERWLDFRACDEKAALPKPYLGVQEWLPNQLWSLLSGSGLAAKDLYTFAERVLKKAARARRASLLAEYLGNSQAHRVTDEHIDLLLKLLDVKRRSAQRMKELETEPIPFGKSERHEHRWFFEGFARDASMTEDAALDWLLKFQPQLFASFEPPAKYLRKCLEPLKRGVWRFDEPVRAKLDAQLAKALAPSHYFYRSRSALDDLEREARNLGFDSYDELRTWAGKHAPQSAVAADSLKEHLIRQYAKTQEEADAKRKATMAKRKATMDKRRAAEEGGAP